MRQMTRLSVVAVAAHGEHLVPRHVPQIGYTCRVYDQLLITGDRTVDAAGNYAGPAPRTPTAGRAVT